MATASGPATPPPDEQGRAVLERLVSFSDAVFAIAMTLMVVQLTVPLIPESLPRAEIGHRLARGLAALRPAYFSFALSFAVIAALWAGHRRRFLPLRRHDSGLTGLNLLLLACVVFIPFPTAVLGRYGDQTVAVVFYAATLAVTGVVSLLLLVYAERRGLAGPGEPLLGPRMVRAAIFPAVFLISIAVAQASPSAAEWSWLALVLVSPVFGRVVGRLRRRRGLPGRGG